jgi:hypothetical protein
MEKELTRYTNVQLTMSWDTKQTMGQYDEIRENNPYDHDEFLEYVKLNFMDWLDNSSQKDIMRELVVLNDEGEVLD